MNITEIVKKLKQAREAYYNSDNPIMSDLEFDDLEDKLREIDPGNEYFSFVGISSLGRKKISHDIPMLSMGKAKTSDEIEAWINRLDLDETEDFILEPKIDGLSATCRYIDGRLMYVATRGDGLEGQDISHIKQYVEDIKEEIPDVAGIFEVRGELYLPKDSDFDVQGRPLRNVCVGLINRKEHLQDLKYVRFAVFQIVGDISIDNESQCLEFLKDKGFNTVAWELAGNSGEIQEYYVNYLNDFRSRWLYETDGLIISVNRRELFPEIDSKWIVDHHHHYAIAYKPPAEIKETVLKKVIWQVSRQGNVIPVANFEPVNVGGATLERATLNNYENVKKLDVHIGDTLLVQRANDVIPFVAGNKTVHEKMENDLSVVISKCPSCASDLVRDGVHLRCINRDCDEKKIQGIIYWVKNSGIENVAEATIRTLYEKEIIRNISDLYNVRKEDLLDLEGFAEKKIRNFIDEIGKSRSMTAVEFISKLGIPLVQKKSLKKIGINSIDDFLNFDDSTYVIGQNVITWKEDEDNMSLFRDISSVIDVEESSDAPSLGKVCMTGKGPGKRNELIERIESMGYEFSPTITKDLNILLCEDPESGSSKISKARKNGIEIISYEEFFSMEQ